jgi:NAD(P)-dependent dehydrogenase (short-subunit alcohol dehydrogenase family)
MSSAVRVALITGAGSGIGRAVTLAFLADGFRVVLAGRREAALRSVLAEAGASGAHGTAVGCDITDASQVQALFARVSRECGRLDVLFNNAGITAPAVPLDELPVEAWNAVVATNLTGPFLCTREAFRIMKNQLARYPRTRRVRVRWPIRRPSTP